MKLLAAGSSVPPSGPASRPESLPASGQMTPLVGGTIGPVETLERPPEKVINLSKEMVADKVDDED